MRATTLEEVCEVVGGRAEALPPRPVSRVATDTRQLQAGDLFVALKGDRFDAQNHLAAARDAAAAIVSRVPPDTPPDLPLIVVADTRRALGDLARHHRRSLTKTKVVAVAGSNGKTTTKNLIHAALRGSLRGTVSPASFNNDVGVPLTLLPVDPADDYVIVEVGTNAPGEVANLAAICEPDVAVITAIGEEHLEGLGDLDGVRRENAAICKSIRPDGTLVLCQDDPELARACVWEGERIGFGMQTPAEAGEPGERLVARDVRVTLDGTTFMVDGRRVRVPLIGRHHATNALVALAVARALGVPDGAAVAGLAEADVPPMRMQRRNVGDGVTLLDDAYNANPASVRAALDTLAELDWPGRKLVVLGDMLELGAAATDYHREAGEHVGRLAPANFLAVGEFAEAMAAASGLPGDRVHCFATSADAADAVAGLVRPGDLVLLKASRGVRLERVAAKLAGAST